MRLSGNFLSASKGVASRKISEWVDADSVMRELPYSRIRFLGHPYPDTLDMCADLLHDDLSR